MNENLSVTNSQKVRNVSPKWERLFVPKCVFFDTTFETPPQPGAGAFKIIFSVKIYTKSDSQTNPFEFYLFPSQHVRSIWGLLDGARSFHTPTHTRAKQRSHTWHSLATRWWQPLLTRPAPLPTSRAKPQNTPSGADIQVT